MKKSAEFRRYRIPATVALAIVLGLGGAAACSANSSSQDVTSTTVTQPEQPVVSRYGDKEGELYGDGHYEFDGFAGSVFCDKKDPVITIDDEYGQAKQIFYVLSDKSIKACDDGYLEQVEARLVVDDTITKLTEAGYKADDFPISTTSTTTV